MSADALVLYRPGEKKPAFVSIQAPNLTVTIQAATFGLKSAAGVVLIPATGCSFDAGALAQPRAWYDLDTTAPTVSVGKYYGTFAITALGSDGITRVYEPVVEIDVRAIVEATYDASLLSTVPLYAVRLHIADTNTANPLFADSELQYFLSLTGLSPELAGARALRAAAADNAKLAVVTKIGPFGNDESKVYLALLAMADALEAQVIAGGSISSPDQVFSTTSGAGTIPGTMDVW